MLESLMQVAAELEPSRARLSVDPAEAALRRARTCYDHFAGRLGVALADALVDQGLVELTNEAGLLTPAGVKFLEAVGLDAGPMLARRTKRSGRVLCRPCFDWSERRPHLGGAIGALICAHSFSNGWTRHLDGTRAVVMTRKGKRIFREMFGVNIE
jgi:hypothetical protein